MIFRNFILARIVSSNREWFLVGGRERVWDRKREKIVFVFINVF